MSQKEREEFEQEKTLAEMSSAHNLRLKELEVEGAKVEASIGAILKLPITLIKLPVYILFGIGYIVAVATKQEPSENFWKFINK